MPITIVRGDDEFAIDKRARELVNSLCPEAEQAMRLETYDGRVGSVDEALTVLGRITEAFNSLGFFGEERVIWIKNPVFLSENQVGKAEGIKDTIQKMAERVSSDGLTGLQVVISGDMISGRNKVLNAVKKVGKIEVLSQPKPWDLEKKAEQTFRERLRSQGLQADATALNRFMERTAQDSRTLKNELDKLLLYCEGQDHVSEEDVRLMVAQTRESAVWDFTDALAGLNIENCLGLLRKYEEQNEPAVKLIYFIENSVELLLTLRVCLDRGYVRVAGGGRGRAQIDWDSSGEAQEFFSSLPNDPSKMNAFRVGKTLTQASRLPVRLLMYWYNQVLETHEKLISTQSPPYLLMECMVLQMLSVAKQKPRRAS